MKKIKIDVVAVPLSGHLYPTLNLVKPLLDDPSMEIRVFTGPQKKAVTESLGFTVVPILEDKVEEFERAANNDKKHNLFSAYRQLSRSLDLINHVSDQLLEEWRVNRISWFCGRTVRNSLDYHHGNPICNRNSLWSSLLLRRDGSRAHEEGREDPSTMP